jgi:hypothetical protein
MRIKVTKMMRIRIRIRIHNNVSMVLPEAKIYEDKMEAVLLLHDEDVGGGDVPVDETTRVEAAHHLS